MDVNSYILQKYPDAIEHVSPVRLSASRHTGLTQLFADAGCKVGVEIGVDRGRYSEQICQANPGVKLYCIDPWTVYSEYIEMRLADRLESNRLATIRRLKQYGCVIKQAYSMDAVKEFENNSLDFVFIDGNHEFDFVMQDIIEWTKKVRPGGIISGHDYVRSKYAHIPCDVIEVVNSYTLAHKIKPWFLFVQDRCPSWMWVK